MSYNSKIHNRRSIRLKGYDYSQAGLYFITICVQNREWLFGKIENDEMILNDAGKMVEIEWLNLKNLFPNIELHEYITMPNHFHGILEIVPVGATLVVAQLTDTQNDDGDYENVVAQNNETKNVVAQNDDCNYENVVAQNDDGDNENVVAQNDRPPKILYKSFCLYCQFIRIILYLA